MLRISICRLAEQAALPLARLSQVRRTHASEVVDGEPESLLEVHGASNVHALFNWLMIQTVSVDYGPPFTSQLPSLLAPLSFLHASLSMPQLTTSHAMLSESEGRVYKLELSGVFGDCSRVISTVLCVVDNRLLHDAVFVVFQTRTSFPCGCAVFPDTIAKTVS